MSKSTTFQLLRLQDENTQKAVSEYITLAELDRTAIKTTEDRQAWEQLWHEFLNSPMWVRAIIFIQKHGI